VKKNKVEVTVSHFTKYVNLLSREVTLQALKYCFFLKFQRLRTRNVILKNDKAENYFTGFHLLALLGTAMANLQQF
jgi:hypothetical protein